eukprot:CAMPEP_0195524054 /NCGR_PEP_ID=MMETSP0794_2-20130614/23685_1 /TAXON_ID=515487 /ORGANISM="Stephanopyxis turris, Strain CCMP 815" /LENGTH=76 /DNA_ID=CAMNT_0040654197 /DNA_START=90 /DNA_END=320 /DNA_ORIENTATION=-
MDAAAQVKSQLFEMEMYSDLFSKMQELCWRKCIAHSKEEELSVGEQSCTDRCVSKYLEAHLQVGEILKEQSQQPQQ